MRFLCIRYQPSSYYVEVVKIFNRVWVKLYLFKKFQTTWIFSMICGEIFPLSKWWSLNDAYEDTGFRLMWHGFVWTGLGCVFCVCDMFSFCPYLVWLDLVLCAVYSATNFRCRVLCALNLWFAILFLHYFPFALLWFGDFRTTNFRSP